MKKLQKGLFILMLGLTFTACGNTTSSLESTGSSNQVAFDVSKNINGYFFIMLIKKHLNMFF